MDKDGVRRAFLRLAGKGEGSTPGGDDLLTGTAAVLIRLIQSAGPQPEWITWLISQLRNLAGLMKDRTTFPSAAYYGFAIEGRFSECVYNAADAVLTGDIQYRRFSPLLSSGETSGKFILLGMMMTLITYLEEDQ